MLDRPRLILLLLLLLLLLVIRPVFGEFVHLSEKGPSPVDSFFLEIISEAPIAKHLKESVMILVFAHVLEVVVFAPSSNALLSVHHATQLP